MATRVESTMASNRSWLKPGRNQGGREAGTPSPSAVLGLDQVQIDAGPCVAEACHAVDATRAKLRTPGRLKLGILAMDGALLSSLSGPLDALRIAQSLASLRDPRTPIRLEGVLVGARNQTSVETPGGLVLSGLQAVPDDLDILLVPGMMHGGTHGLRERMAGLGPEIELIRQLRLRGTHIAATCSGTLLLAASGLLDGHRATTSWWLAASFRKHFPHVRLQADSMLIEDAGLVTTGAATAVLGLVIHLIEAAGSAELAQHTARLMLIDSERQSQAPYISAALLEKPRSSLSERIDKYLQRELHQELSVAGLAEHCGVSERSLLRHFRQHYGQSPLHHIQHLRVERAKALLETTQLSFDEVVERCGYSDVSSFRKLFKRATTLTPADYRERFRLRSA